MVGLQATQFSKLLLNTYCGQSLGEVEEEDIPKVKQTTHFFREHVLRLKIGWILELMRDIWMQNQDKLFFSHSASSFNCIITVQRKVETYIFHDLKSNDFSCGVFHLFCKPQTRFWFVGSPAIWGSVKSSIWPWMIKPRVFVPFGNRILQTILFSKEGALLFLKGCWLILPPAIVVYTA